MTFHNTKQLIGRAEPIDFIDQGLLGMPAKIDTGAYRSSIHASNIHVDAEGLLHCTLFVGHPAYKGGPVDVVTSDFKTVRITSSFGNKEDRYEIKLKIKLSDTIVDTSFTLADRSKNSFPVLVGRKLLNNRFIVDTASSGINRKNLKRNFGITESEEEDQ